jgi:hypothetical protein
MCRWLAYSGSPILLSRALYTPAHSLIDQSLHSTMGAEPTNGDGFGIGWYDAMPEPGVFHSIEPAWNDANLRELAGHTTTVQRPTNNTRLRRRRTPPGPHAREHPRTGYEQPPRRPRSTLDSGLSRRNPVLRYPTREYQPDRASRTRQDRRPLSRAHPTPPTKTTRPHGLDKHTSISARVSRASRSRCPTGSDLG